MTDSVARRYSFVSGSGKVSCLAIHACRSVGSRVNLATVSRPALLRKLWITSVARDGVAGSWSLVLTSIAGYMKAYVGVFVSDRGGCVVGDRGRCVVGGWDGRVVPSLGWWLTTAM